MARKRQRVANIESDVFGQIAVQFLSDGSSTVASTTYPLSAIALATVF
ncbi:hypothetical protein ACTOWK_04020 [Lysobacter sp. CA196]